MARVVKALCGRHLSPAHRPSSLGARRAPILLCGGMPSIPVRQPSIAVPWVFAAMTMAHCSRGM
ncbi:hypothetical protein CZ771_01645 [Actinomycetales bacterium JB111]|nr:hypothetical protein CZ771_01645 [Actinomycetales bacterium JB111]